MEAIYVQSKRTKQIGVATFGYPYSEFWFVKFEGDRAGRWIHCLSVQIKDRVQEHLEAA